MSTTSRPKKARATSPNDYNDTQTEDACNEEEIEDRLDPEGRTRDKSRKHLPDLPVFSTGKAHCVLATWIVWQRSQKLML